MRRHIEAIGAASGLVLWLACHLQPAHVPPAFLFYVTAIAFVFGCGALALIRFEETTPLAERTAIACAVGVAIAPLLMALVALARVPFLFPPAAFAATGAMAARWRFRPIGSPFAGAREGKWYLIVSAIVFAIAAWASSGRLRI